MRAHDHALDRRDLLRAGAATTAAGLLVAGGAAPAYAGPRVGRVLARGLSYPWGLTFLPNGDALVGERGSALVHRVSRKGGRRLVGEVSGVVAEGEGGLLGLVRAPDFTESRLVYAYLTSADDNRVVRMRYVDGRLRDLELVLAGIPKGTIHNGGRLRFGPGGLLFASTGDAGDPNLAQDQGSLGGKILRITRTGGVPAGNPFGTEVWSLGHRNVQGLAFDGRGRLWATEFGTSEVDELNRIVKAGNYGWPEVEGGDGDGPYQDPFVTWSPTEICSPSGVALRRGYAYVGALRGQALWRVDLKGPGRGRKRRFLHEEVGRIRTVERAPDQTLWITTSNGDDDRVLRVVF